MQTKTEAASLLAGFNISGTAAEIRKQLKDQYGIEFGNANLSQTWIDAAVAVERYHSEIEREAMEASVLGGEPDETESNPEELEAYYDEQEAIHLSEDPEQLIVYPDSPEDIQQAANDELLGYLENQVAEVAPEPQEFKVLKVNKENIDSLPSGQSATLVSVDEAPLPKTTQITRFNPENLMQPWYLVGIVRLKKLLSYIQPKRPKAQGFGISVDIGSRQGSRNRRYYNRAMQTFSTWRLAQMTNTEYGTIGLHRSAA